VKHLILNYTGLENNRNIANRLPDDISGLLKPI